MQLTNEHTDYIIKDLTYRGIVAEGIQDELIDHVCSAVEKEMESGTRFFDAYQKILKQFGNTAGLRKTQETTIQSENPKLMIRNYLLIAVRNLRKQSVYSVINVLGLAVGVAACLVMVLFIADELSYDRHWETADRVYRIEADVKFGGNEFQMTYRSAPEAETLLMEYPEIESAVRFRTAGNYFVRDASKTENGKENYVAWADSTFFKIFPVKILEGNGAKALNEPASVAISQRIAEKYFPGTSALGQSILLDNKYLAKVTAVYENIPRNSHFHFDILTSMVGDWAPIAKEAKHTSYMSESFTTYLLLKPGTDVKALEAKFLAYQEKYMGPEIRMAFGDGASLAKLREGGSKYDMSLRPIADIHLRGNLRGEFEPNGNITYVYLLATVAAFILIIACINFMNLSTARSANRAKEVGVRKVMGSLRSHLMRQFLTESALITTFAFVIALILAYALLPIFNDMAQKQLSIPFANPFFYLTLIGAIVIVGLMAGLYPSFFLSAFKPVNVLKGQMALGLKSGMIRSSLVVFQFAISIFLIVGAIGINRQFEFIQNKKLGFEKDQVIVIHDTYALRPSNQEPFKTQVLNTGVVESASISGYVPVESAWAHRSNNTFWEDGKEPSSENLVSSQIWGVDHDYIATYGMKITAGRNFSPASAADQTGVILNETAVKNLGLGADPIGKKIHSYDGAPSPENVIDWTVIGVIEDFHFASMKQNISPLGLYLTSNDGSVSFRFQPDKAREAIAAIEKVWKQLAPGAPFEYSFLDEDFEEMYRAEERLSTVFSLFAGLTILIACLGLFALTAFTAEQRTKEIGIRKVLGASAQSIVFLLSKEFGKLIAIAFVLATPVAWYAISWWLNGYSYKVEITWVVYAVSGAVAGLVAITTMSFQAIKAASTDPVKSLRSE